MNCGLQDAFNLAWKLALVHQGAAHENLLDSYEIERRPAAELVMKSGDNMEDTLTMTGPTERKARDQAILFFGEANSSFPAGYRLPDNIPVRPPHAAPSNLHALGHHAGSTLMLLGGPTADPSTLLSLHAAMQKHVGDSPLFETAVALTAGAHVPDSIGHLEPAAAAQLGIEGNTLLAIRPDGYVGLRADRDHLAALDRYAAFLQTGLR